MIFQLDANTFPNYSQIGCRGDGFKFGDSADAGIAQNDVPRTPNLL
jgi:hypothetical protein